MGDKIRYFYDFEFLEDGRIIEPISVGIAAHPGGRTYYAVFSEIAGELDGGNKELHQRICAHQFLWDQVLPRLPLRKGREKGMWSFENSRHFNLDTTNPIVKPKWVIANEVRAFLQAPLSEQELAQDDTSRVELWADYGAYDHVRLMQLWGPMMSRPKGLPMWTHDLQQYVEQTGLDPDKAPTTLGEAEAHNAGYDALRLREQWLWMRTQEIERRGGAPMAMSDGSVVEWVSGLPETDPDDSRVRYRRPIRDDPQA